MENREETEPSKYIQFLDAISKTHEIAKLLEKGQDDRPDKQGAFEESLRDYAYREMEEILSTDKADDKIGEKERECKEKLKLIKPEEGLDKDTVQYIINFGLITSREKSAILVSNPKNLESILEEISPESYRKMSRYNEIAERVSGDEKKVFGACRMWQYFEDFKKNYQEHIEEGKPLSEKQQEEVAGLGAKGLGDKLAKKYKDKGFSKKIQDEVRMIANQAAKYHYVNLEEYVIPGLESAAKEHKDKYEEIAKDSGTIETLCKNILKRMATSDSKDEFNLARNLIYETSDRNKETAKNVTYKTGDKSTPGNIEYLKQGKTDEKEAA